MTDLLEAPANEQPAPLFIQPSAADKAPRKAPGAPTVKPMPADPEAPYGWITDPITKEVRPRKTAGRRAKGAPKPVAAPKARAAAKPRATPPPAGITAPVTAVQDINHAEMVGDIVDAAWMIAASVPMPKPGRKLFGLKVYEYAIRAKAQASVLKQERDTLAMGVGQLADHVPAVSKAVQWLGREDGPTWMLTAAALLSPVVASSSAIWSMPIAEVETIAANVDTEFKEIVNQTKNAMIAAAQMQAQQNALAAEAASGGRYPGEVPFPMFGDGNA